MSLRLPPTSPIFRAARVMKVRRPLWLEQPIIPGIEPVEPDGDGTGRETTIALTMNYRQTGVHLVAAVPLQLHWCGFEVGVHRYHSTRFPLRGSVLQSDHLANLALRIGDHSPSDRGDLDGSHSGFDRQEEHRAVSTGIGADVEFSQNGPDLLVADDLCLLAESH